MADSNVTQENIKETFRKAVNEHKEYIRASVLEELIESCYAAIRDDKKITDVISLKEWLEAKLQREKEALAAEMPEPPKTPFYTEESLRAEWAAKRKGCDERI